MGHTKIRMLTNGVSHPKLHGLTRSEIETIVDALNVRALDRQADHYGDAFADLAAELFSYLTGEDPHEAFSEEGD